MKGARLSKTLVSKLLLVYAVLAAGCLLFLQTLGVRLIVNAQTVIRSDALYRGAYAIAKECGEAGGAGAVSAPELYRELLVFSEAESADVRVIAPDGTVVVSSAEEPAISFASGGAGASGSDGSVNGADAASGAGSSSSSGEAVNGADAASGTSGGDAVNAADAASGTASSEIAGAAEKTGGGRIANFDHTAFGPRYYEVSTFFGLYSHPYLNVLVPIISDLKTTGYVAVSVPMSDLDGDVARIRRAVSAVALILFLSSLLLLLHFVLAVHRPIGKIAAGAREFASGNLQHRIAVSSDDEMGRLADSLNYMADELQKNADYQKRFIGNVSHDFRSPLTSIKGFTEAMRDGTIPPEMYDHYLEIIAGEAERLEKLTSGVLMLSGMDQQGVILDESSFDINEVMRHTATVFEGSCRKKKIQIRLLLEGETLEVRADKEKIEQVLYNLLDNAIKFSGRGAVVELETTQRRGRCYVSVRDEGCGIPSGELQNIWARFYKADSSRGRDRGGSGLGLAIVKEIISAHGQNINVMSTEGAGTEFVFTLNLA